MFEIIFIFFIYVALTVGIILSIVKIISKDILFFSLIIISGFIYISIFDNIITNNKQWYIIVPTLLVACVYTYNIPKIYEYIKKNK